jgi:hypothetical protein
MQRDRVAALKYGRTAGILEECGCPHTDRSCAISACHRSRQLWGSVYALRVTTNVGVRGSTFEVEDHGGMMSRNHVRC